MAKLFDECAIAFVPSSSLTPKLISDMSAILEDNGAKILEHQRDGSLNMKHVTHIVSNTIDFQQYNESQGYMIPVVTMTWITTSISRRKIAQVRPYSPDPRMIFAQVIVSCADLPEMDKESILGATMALGGQETKDINKLTTHICALSMDSEKVSIAQQRGWKGKVVLPHWFDDCFKLGKRIDESPYLLPEAEILKKSPQDPLDIPVNENLEGASSASPHWDIPLPSSDEAARAPSTVFQHKKLVLAEDLPIAPRHFKMIKDIISNGGGKVVSDIEDCDMYIGHYRDGAQYIQAAQSCKDVGNLSWLYYLIVHNEWTSPLQRLLHYPVPRHGIPGFEKLRITVSNYGGEARIYLENLIKACGAEFTKTMKADNTHLITARDSSEKCRAAPEWGVAVVNHLWIEESYAKCQMKAISERKYTHFPPRTNLGEIIGRTFFDEATLREVYYPGGEQKLSPGSKRKRKVLEAAEDNTYHNGPADGLTLVQADDEENDEEESGDAMDVDEVEEKPAKRAVQTPIRPKRVSTDKENDTPSVISTGGRSAKAKARDMIHNIAPDIALYEKEKKRQGKANAPFGGKRAADLAEKEKAAKDAAKAAKAGAKAEQNDEEQETKRPAKKARASLPDVDMRIILTGFSRWVGDQRKEDQDRRKLRDLGIQIVQEGQACDFLAAPQVVRTVKFLCALARGPQILSSTFIDKVLEDGAVPDVDSFILKDKDAETRFDFKLQRSVARAKANRGRLLQGIAIYCTDNIRNGSESYKAIAEANGAIFKIYRARSGTTIKPTTAEEDGGAAPDPVYLLSGLSKEEKQMWSKFKDMAEKGNMEPRIVSPDWLLDVAMAQQVRFDDKFLAEES